MNINDLIQQLIAAGGPIDAAWNMFIFVHFGLIGGIYAINRPLIHIEKIAIIALYSIFAWINYSALVYNYNLYQLILADIKVLAPSNAGLFLKTKQFLSSHEFESRTNVVTMVHVTAFIMVAIFVLLEDKIVGRAQRSRSVNITSESNND